MYILRGVDRTIKKLNILSFVFLFLIIPCLAISFLVINSSDFTSIKNILIFGSISLASIFLIFFIITKSIVSSLKESVKHIYDEGYVNGERDEEYKNIQEEENYIFTYLDELNPEKFPNITKHCKDQDYRIMLMDGLRESINYYTYKKEVIDNKLSILENSLNTFSFNSDKFQKQLWIKPSDRLVALGYMIIDRFHEIKSSGKK